MAVITFTPNVLTLAGVFGNADFYRAGPVSVVRALPAPPRATSLVQTARRAAFSRLAVLWRNLDPRLKDPAAGHDYSNDFNGWQNWIALNLGPELATTQTRLIPWASAYNPIVNLQQEAGPLPGEIRLTWDAAIHGYNHKMLVYLRKAGSSPIYFDTPFEPRGVTVRVRAYKNLTLSDLEPHVNYQALVTGLNTNTGEVTRTELSYGPAL